LPKEDSIKIIEKVKTAIVFIPLEKHFRANVFGVESQDHLSLWTEEDFKSRGYQTQVLKDFHYNELGERFDALWAIKKTSMEKNKELFTAYYSGNLWGDPETVSGPGSTLEHTKGLGQYIGHIIATYGIKWVLDAPCGDYHWFKDIERDSSVFYTGGDIVEELIEKNNKLYWDETTGFIKLDIVKDLLPGADLMVCRECLQHLPDEDVLRFIENFKNSNIKYLLVTSYEVSVNINTVLGGYRCINMRLAPFNFGPPLLVFEEWTWKGTPKKLLLLYGKNLK
jgi:hypothetical protein